MDIVRKKQVIFIFIEAKGSIDNKKKKSINKQVNDYSYQQKSYFKFLFKVFEFKVFFFYPNSRLKWEGKKILKDKRKKDFNTCKKLRIKNKQLTTIKPQ